MRDLINIIENLSNSWNLDIKAIRLYQLPKSIRLYHATDNNKLVISSKEFRLIPDSLSAKTVKDKIWGKNIFTIKVPADTVVAEVSNIFDLLPNNVEDSPINIGKKLKAWADKHSVQIIKIRNVAQVGTEWAIIDPALLH